MAADRRGRARVFTFGLGADVNVALLEELAIEGSGTAQFVRPSESIERVVSVVAQRLGTPVLTDLRLEANGVRLRQVYPQLPTDVFAGQDLVILARYEGEGRGNIELTGATPQGVVRIPVSASFPARERDNVFVARLWAIRRIGYLTAERRRSGSSSEVDDEIRELGQRFGIPTELSSYLVLEPGMERFADAASQAQPVRPTASIGRINGGRDMSGNAPAPPPAARASGEVAFESARVSAQQRSATTLTSSDAALPSNVQSAGGRTFALRDGVWTDMGSTATNARRVRVQPFSELYFALMREIPDLRAILALGEQVVVLGRRVTIELHAEGATRLGDAELQSVIRDW